MFVFLLSLYGSVSVESQSSSFTSVQTGGRRMTKSENYKTGYKQNGTKVFAHESRRNRTSEEENGLAQTWDRLVQKTGRKDGENRVVTKARDAVGYGVQPSGQSETSQLTVTKSSNTPISVAGLYFNPYASPRVETSQIFCRDGRCGQV